MKACQALADYLADRYERVKYELKVPHPARAPEYAAVAGMRDLRNGLAGRARIVRDEQRGLGS